MKPAEAVARSGLSRALARLASTYRPCTALLGIGVLHACSTVPTERPEESRSPASERLNIPVLATVDQRRPELALPLPREPHPEPGGTGSEGLWRRIVQGFAFALEHDNETVRSELAWYRDNSRYLQEVAERAAPFLYSIVEEIDRREMPLELALLPIVESAYDPEAVSGRNAAGLWQFMPATARAMGLKQDWWYDGRRDPIASTRAAMDYLQSLHQRFDGDWLLALAAYNAGQGTVSNAIRRNERRGRDTDFWSLPLPDETRRHVPRVIALAHLLARAGQHELELELLEDEPFLATVDVQSQIDLSLAAQLTGLEPARVYSLNPGYRQWATHPDGPHTIALPVDAAETLRGKLDDLAPEQRVTWDRYQIRSGDTLGGIAQRFGTRAEVLREVNNLSGSRIVAGESLLIPRGAGEQAPADTQPVATVAATDSQQEPSPNPAPTIHRVRRGDSLWDIAQRYGLDTEELARWNGLSMETLLQPGQILQLHRPSTVALEDGNGEEVYRVRPGDSLYRIANRFDLSVEQLASHNDIRPRELIHPGQELRLPVN